MTFGEWLKSQREDRGMSLRDVERASEGAVSNALISQIETGKVKRPSLHACIQIAAALGLSASEMLERAVAESQTSPAPDFCPHCGQIMRPDRKDF
jgi:transcriptional regulator with XRE-family HTH domain